MANFEIVKGYSESDVVLPTRATKYSAGYDFTVAADTYIEPISHMQEVMFNSSGANYDAKTLEEIAKITKNTKAKPALVPTGVKCQLAADEYLEISVRSSCPLKHWLILANGIGIIDSDYYGNPTNDGHIFFQMINLSPFPILLKKGDKIGQGIIKKYITTENDESSGTREGGFGSTSNKE